uniref:Uncharacterized protein n=1 Tax=Anguilla anguilla TaxID=7936 RepID=A0A0E9TJ71_ANGAN
MTGGRDFSLSGFSLSSGVPPWCFYFSRTRFI